MDRLKRVIEQYGRWTGLSEYTERIETSLATDFSNCIENAKALLETIGKEICRCNNVELGKDSSINIVLKKAFYAIGYDNSNMVNQISTSLSTIGQQIGNLRNEIGATSHGRPLIELKERNNKVDELTREFLIDSTIIVACFLIRAFENENPRESSIEDTEDLYKDNEDFNNFWDDLYGEFEMGDYAYSASEILYNVDYAAYITEKQAYSESEEGAE